MNRKSKCENINISKEWNIVENEFDIAANYKNETIFSLGNGFLGIRGNFEEGYSGPKNTTFNATYINGFYEEYDIEYPEGGYGFPKKGDAMVNVADAKIIKPVIDGEELDLLKGKLHFYQRILDMKSGILKRRFIWESPSGKVVECNIKRMVSFQRPNLVAISYDVKPINFDGKLSFISKINGRVFNQSENNDVRVGSGIKEGALRTVDLGVDESGCFMKLKTSKSNLYLVCATEHHLSSDEEFLIFKSLRDDDIELKFELNVKKGKNYTLFKYISYFTSRDHHENHLIDLAKDEVRIAKEHGFELLEDEQKRFLEEFWEDADIIIEGDPLSQQGIRFCIFSILQSTGRDGKTSIPAKGLTGEGYGGHYFWDTEIYVMPFYVYNFPQIAKALLMYRYNILDTARERAKELGHKGALYPWRTISGSECSAYFPAGTAQYHINADIMYALKQYIDATEDKEFLYDYGAEMLFETARFWLSLGSYIPLKGNKFCINCVTGPDEYTALVDNNAYTNYMAQMNLDYAVRVVEEMKMLVPDRYKVIADKIGLMDEEVKEWKKAAENMYLPYSEELGIIPQDDGFVYKKRIPVSEIPENQFPLLLNWHYLNIYRYQICKQPDVLLLMYLLREKFAEDEIRKNYDYYEPITTHDSSLSPAIFSILACEIGYMDKAYSYFLRSVRMDLEDYNGNTKDGIHVASMGGAWSAIVNGFAGLKIYDGALHFAPSLPKTWNKLSFSIKYKGREITVSISKSAASYTLIKGEPFEIYHYDEKLILEEGVIVKKGVGDVEI